MTPRARTCLLGLLLGLGCKAAGPRSPEQLRAAYLAALEKNDADAAYRLLSPEAQARISREEFRHRWDAHARERKAQLAASRTMAADEATAAREATTTHKGGRVLEWTRVGDDWLVRSGLPGVPSTSTPVAAVRAFLEAVRHTDLESLRSVVAEDLLARVREDWSVRARAIERALERPDAVQLSADARRAELRYGKDRAITLEQTPNGWRITAFE